jgi:hypothetical protein
MNLVGDKSPRGGHALRDALDEYLDAASPSETVVLEDIIAELE